MFAKLSSEAECNEQEGELEREERPHEAAKEQVRAPEPRRSAPDSKPEPAAKDDAHRPHAGEEDRMQPPVHNLLMTTWSKAGRREKPTSANAPAASIRSFRVIPASILFAQPFRVTPSCEVSCRDLAPEGILPGTLARIAT